MASRWYGLVGMNCDSAFRAGFEAAPLSGRLPQTAPRHGDAVDAERRVLAARRRKAPPVFGVVLQLLDDGGEFGIQGPPSGFGLGPQSVFLLRVRDGRRRRRTRRSLRSRDMSRRRHGGAGGRKRRAPFLAAVGSGAGAQFGA